MNPIHSVKGFRNVVDLISLINEGGYQFSWADKVVWHKKSIANTNYSVEKITLHADSKDKQMSQSFSFDDCLCNWDDNEHFGELDTLLRKRKTVQFTLEIELTEGRTHSVVISSISAKATTKSFIISFTSIDGEEHQLIQLAPITEVSN